MPASDDETGSGPVVHDNRRIDPVTGQVRGRHAASKPAGTSGAGRPAGASGSARAAEGEPETGEDDIAAAEAAVASAAAAVAEATEAVEAVEATEAVEAVEATEAVEVTEAVEAVEAADDADDADDADEVIEGIVEDVIVADRQGAVADAEARLAERTADLQRLQAEYANYRKRVDRDRAAVREQAVAATLAGLLPVLDAISQARDHGELSGGFKSVADSLQAALGRLGLVTYGEKGDRFDPKIHEALTSTYSPDVAEDTCIEILQPGYQVGDRILRPARVAVAEPAIGPDGISNEAE
jgi:molecular chaperone GrpE